MEVSKTVFGRGWISALGILFATFVVSTGWAVPLAVAQSDEACGAPKFSESMYKVGEEVGSVTLTIEGAASGGDRCSNLFKFWTEDRSAKHPGDYTKTTNSGPSDSFWVGADYRIVVPIKEDTIGEANEYFEVLAIREGYGVVGTPKGAQGKAAVVIIDNDPSASSSSSENLKGGGPNKGGSSSPRAIVGAGQSGLSSGASSEQDDVVQPSEDVADLAIGADARDLGAVSSLGLGTPSERTPSGFRNGVLAVALAVTILLAGGSLLAWRYRSKRGVI